MKAIYRGSEMSLTETIEYKNGYELADEEHVMNQEQKVKELMRRTGKGKIACGISLGMSNWDIEAAIKRMRVAYPSMEVKD